MSLQAAQSFITAATQDQAIQGLIRSGLESGKLDLMGLAQQYGYEFSSAEGEQAWAAHIDTAELSDLELELVSGGGSLSCNNVGY
ncbi:MAG: Nif11-like leader peptide family natural product precursor [Burkholderiales bacterium]